MICFSNLSDSTLQNIAKSDLEGVNISPPTNELAERVLRMVNEKICNCKSVKSLENHMNAYFNDSEARLNIS